MRSGGGVRIGSVSGRSIAVVAAILVGVGVGVGVGLVLGLASAASARTVREDGPPPVVERELTETEGAVVASDELVARFTSDRDGLRHGYRDLEVGPAGRIWFTSFRNVPTGCGPGGPSCGLAHEAQRAFSAGGGGGVLDGPVDLSDGPPGLGVGPDGEVWFLRSQGLGRVTPALATAWPGPGNPGDLTTGPDDRLWFVTEHTDLVGWIDPDTGVGATHLVGLDDPHEIVAGPDGNLWVTSTGNDRIVRITTAGAATSWDEGIDAPKDIVVGPDGNLWFSSSGNDRIGRITPSGDLTLFADPAGLFDGPDGLVWGPGGFLYVTSAGNNRLGVLSQTGAVATVPLPHFGPGPTTPGEIVATTDAIYYLTGDRVVRATNASPPSAPVWVTTTPGFRPVLRWSPPAINPETVVAYRVYRDGELIATRPIENLTEGFRDTTAPPGHTYQYEVAPVTTGGEGPRAQVNLATPVTGSITIATDTQPGMLATDVAFQGCGPQPAWCGDFSLDDDDDPQLPNDQSGSGLVPGTYTVTQTSLPAGYSLVEIACPGGEPVVDLANRRVTINLGTGATDIACTFELEAETSLTIVLRGFALGERDIEPDVGFEGCAGPNACGSFALDDDDDPTLPDRVAGYGIAPGTYTVTLTDLPPGSTLAGFSGSCGTTDLAARRATIVITGPGDRFTCTFRVQPNYLAVFLNAGGDLGEQVDVERCGPGAGPCTDLTVTEQSGHTMTTLVPGTHTLTLDLPSGTSLAGIWCSGGAPDYDLASRQVSVTMADGGINCSFTLAVNQIRISLDSQARGTRADVGFVGCLVSAQTCAPFVLDDDAGLSPTGDSVHSDSHVERRLPAGTYEVTLTDLPASLDLDDIVCVGDGATGDVANGRVTLVLAAQHDVHCTFHVGGSSVAGILVGGTEPVAFEACGPTPTSCDEYLLDGVGGGHDDRRAEAGLPAGTYTITVTDLPAGHTLESISCTDDPATTVDLGQRRVTIQLTSQRVWCTFAVDG